MKFCILKDRIRELLAAKLAEGILKTSKEDLVKILNYTSLGGFQLLDDEDLIENLLIHLPVVDNFNLVDTDSEKFIFEVKIENSANEERYIHEITQELKLVYFD